MKVVRTIAESRDALAPLRTGSVGLVPTMGSLHEGHLALLRAARAENDTVVMSLFVNPAQFGDASDLARYPRDEERDLGLARDAGVDLVFAPSTDEMYPSGFQTWVDVTELGAILEGRFRPGHFRGVATVVLKLLNVVRPTRVYFGQKDAQQVEVIRRLIADLALEVELRAIPTVRDADGLALSSRNALLSPEERAAALAFPRALADTRPRRGPRRARVLQRPRDRLRRGRGLRPTRSRRRCARRSDPPHRQRPTGRRRRMSIRPQRPAPATPAPGKLPITELPEMKARRQPIVMVTAYDAPGGRLADQAGADLVLVGDSAAMTVLGHDSTVPATMEEMLILTRAVTRGASRPLVIADMPFGSFQVSDEDAVENAIRFVKEAGADAVKLEGAGAMLSRVKAIVDAGIPVMGHLGLTPQSATMLGGFKAQGRSAEKALRLLRRRARARGGGLLLARPRGRAGARGRAHHPRSLDPDDRDRRRAGLRRPGARLARHPRPLRRSRRTLRQALRRDRGVDPRRRLPRSPGTCASAAFPRSSTRTRCRTTSSRSSRAPSQIIRNTPSIAARSARGRDDRGERAQPRPPVRDAHADDEERERPGDERELDDEQHPLAGPLVGAAAAKRVAAVEREPQRQHEEERRGERHEREADGLSRPSEVPEAPEEPDAEVEGEAGDEVPDEPVQPARR